MITKSWEIIVYMCWRSRDWLNQNKHDFWHFNPIKVQDFHSFCTGIFGRVDRLPFPRIAEVIGQGFCAMVVNYSCSMSSHILLRNDWSINRHEGQRPATGSFNNRRLLVNQGQLPPFPVPEVTQNPSRDGASAVAGGASQRPLSKPVRRRRAATSRLERLWEHGVIPYDIDSRFSG